MGSRESGPFHFYKFRNSIDAKKVAKTNSFEECKFYSPVDSKKNIRGMGENYIIRFFSHFEASRPWLGAMAVKDI